jgi:hypothetical protein
VQRHLVCKGRWDRKVGNDDDYDYNGLIMVMIG